jgi:isopentenyl diphosphate isomerase/L-lactate dehydrogenase-like FMN-dependent dehydrogenase
VTTTAMYPHDADFVAIEEIRATAMKNLPPEVADFLETGAGTERTLRANREAFDRWVIRPRPMSGVSVPGTASTLLGIPLSLPVLTAPFGGDGMFGADGHLAVARANASCGTVSIVPEVGTYSYEDVRAAAPAAARIAQVHPYESFDHVVKRIGDAGYDALCVTVDCPLPGFRVRNRMNRFAPDWSVFCGNVADDGTPSVAETFGEMVSEQIPAWDWERLAEATHRHGLPWIAKGILTPEAARAALDAGAAAIYVSSHGGRQVDPAPASLDVLPEVAAAVAGRVPVLFDSGVRSGADLLLALALGADAVVIGRLAAYGLAAAGEAGVRRTIELLAEELRTLMILAGIPGVDQIPPGTVVPRYPVPAAGPAAGPAR